MISATVQRLFMNELCFHDLDYFGGRKKSKTYFLNAPGGIVDVLLGKSELCPH